jgi:hypothetical protein
MIVDVAIGAAVRAGHSAVVLRSWWDREKVRVGGEMRQRLAGLAERGAGGREAGRERATRAVDRAVTALAASRLVDMVVDIQMERLLDRLADEPERVRTLLRGQRETLVSEAVGRVRSGTATADSVVDRFTLRMTRPGGSADTP